MPNLVTKREAAEILGVDVSTVQKMMRDGLLKPHKTFDGPVRASLHLFNQASVDRLAKSRNQQAS